MYCIIPIYFFTAPSKPNLSMIRLLVSIPQILVTNNSPIPVFDAKNAKPVTNVPPIIPPSQDHQGRSKENIGDVNPVAWDYDHQKKQQDCCRNEGDKSRMD